jgi:hypothetical protein
MAERPALGQRKEHESALKLERGFVYFENVVGNHRVLPLDASPGSQLAAQFYSNILGEKNLARAQSLIFNALLGPNPVRFVGWISLPLDEDGAAQSVRALAREVAGGKQLRTGRFIADHAGLTTLPIGMLEVIVVGKGRTQGRTQRPGEDEDTPKLPAIPLSLEESAENAGFLLARRISSLAKEPERVVSEVASVLERLHAPVLRELEAYLATYEAPRIKLSEAGQDAIARLRVMARQLALPTPDAPKLKEASAALGQALATEIRALAPETPAGLADLDRTLSQIAKRFAVADAPLIAALNAYLGTLKGQTLESYEANKALVSKVQGFAAALGLKFKCPTCHVPSTLVLARASRLPLGAFQFRHSGDEPGTQTRHGGASSIPALRLIARGDR